jgi:hypothetical protein
MPTVSAKAATINTGTGGDATKDMGGIVNCRTDN